MKIETDTTAIINEGLLSLRAINRLKKISNKQKRNQVIYGDLLLQYVLTINKKQYTPEEISFNTNGKPLLPEGFLNISNCNEWILLAYSTIGEVGADIEQYKECNLGLALYFFTEDEVKKLRSIPNTNFKSTAFIDAWTFKESYVKCKGIKLVDIKNKVNTPFAHIPFIKHHTIIDRQSFFYLYGFIKDYKWCVGSTTDFKSFNIKVLQITDVYRHVDYMRRNL
ncbi:4'-phosphopantetheinyl transferase family protein [Alkalicoccobacillus porphyridii]|nr:4'-phosphopantetheinyl transferase superfamily protein [Alkalicoccobacillus porphyridii]